MNVHEYLFGTTTRKMVYKSLDAGAMRSRAIANNLANVQTPGFQRKEIDFERHLQKAFRVRLNGETTTDRHMPIGKGIALQKVSPRTYTPQEKTLPGEINNVDIDLEAAKLAENQILYNFGIRFAGFKKLNSAIAGRPTD